MPNYNESNISGTKWRRARSVVIDNTYGRPPIIAFSEEDIVSFDNSTMAQGMPPEVPPLRVLFNPSSIIDLIDPDTGNPLGTTITHMELYTALNSLYRQLAATRDTQGTV